MLPTTLKQVYLNLNSGHVYHLQKTNLLPVGLWDPIKLIVYIRILALGHEINRKVKGLSGLHES